MSTQTKLPAGWRWLRVGEIIASGDEIEIAGDWRPVAVTVGLEVKFPNQIRRPISVRDAKPAKKATKKKAKRVKVRVGRVIGSRTVGLCSEMSSSSRVLVIPFDAASREAIVEQMVDVMFARYPHSELDRDLITADTRRQLATLHPDFAKEGR
jgi:hypothetical protein